MQIRATGGMYIHCTLHDMPQMDGLHVSHGQDIHICIQLQLFIFALLGLWQMNSGPWTKTEDSIGFQGKKIVAWRNDKRL